MPCCVWRRCCVVPAAAVASALKLSNAEAARLRDLLSDRPAPQPGLDDMALRRMLADEPADLLLGRSWLRQDDGDPAAWDEVRGRLRRMTPPVFPLAGRDLLAAGVAAGPTLGALLAATRAWWREGGCVADQAGCLAYGLDSASRDGLLPRARPGC